MPKPWEEVALKTNQKLAYEFESGWLFARVMGRSVAHYLFDLVGNLAANPTPTNPPSEARYDFTILFTDDVPPRRILYHTHTKEIWQVFPSLTTPRTRFFMNLPMDTARNGLRNEIGNAPNSFNRPFGWRFEGWESPAEAPTDAGEFFLPPETDLEIGLINMELFEVRPQMHFIINQLSLSPFNPETEVGRRAITDMVNPPLEEPENKRTRIATPGITPFRMDETTFVRLFGVRPVSYDGARLMVGEEVIAEVV